MDIIKCILSGFGPVIRGGKSPIFRGGSAEFSVEPKYSFHVGLVWELPGRV